MGTSRYIEDGVMHVRPFTYERSVRRTGVCTGETSARLNAGKPDTRQIGYARRRRIDCRSACRGVTGFVDDDRLCSPRVDMWSMIALLGSPGRTPGLGCCRSFLIISWFIGRGRLFSRIRGIRICSKIIPTGTIWTYFTMPNITE